jgi:hypothetical protein
MKKELGLLEAVIAFIVIAIIFLICAHIEFLFTHSY